MTVKTEYLRFKEKNSLRNNKFSDRVLLQRFLRDRLEDIWQEKPRFTNGGLFRNHMTGFALGFAYYDCEPTAFCRTRCYGLPVAGVNDYYMFRLAVITSESLKSGDPRYLAPLSKKLRSLKYVKVGHWGDAVLDQVPVLARLATKHPENIFWWYTRKIEVALAANRYGLPNVKAYLSLDPSTPYPSQGEYPFGITYFFGEKQFNKNHNEILHDSRLVAIFTQKRGQSIEAPEQYGIGAHPKMCLEKKYLSQSRKRGNWFCLSCSGRCNYAPMK